MSNKPLLELYYFDACPYCQRVLKVIKELSLKVVYKDIHSNLNEMEKLLAITGTKMVPCLFIDGVPMHESLDIMNWLKTNQASLEKA
jgi:glutathione S-transferase